MISVYLSVWNLAAAGVVWDVHTAQSIDERWSRVSCGCACIELLLRGLRRRKSVHNMGVGSVGLPSGSSEEQLTRYFAQVRG